MSHRQTIQERERVPGDQVIHDTQGQPLLLDDPERVEEPDEDNELVEELIGGADDEDDEFALAENDEEVEDPPAREEDQGFISI